MKSPSDALRSALVDVPSNARSVGIDIVDLAELERILDAGGSGLRDAVWTRAEQADCDGCISRLGARWAAKEAVMKALGHGLGEVDPLDVEIQNSEFGAPHVSLKGSAADHARRQYLNSWSVSFSHEAGWAAAIAFAVTINSAKTVESGALG